MVIAGSARHTAGGAPPDQVTSSDFETYLSLADCLHADLTMGWAEEWLQTPPLTSQQDQGRPSELKDKDMNLHWVLVKMPAAERPKPFSVLDGE